MLPGSSLSRNLLRAKMTQVAIPHSFNILGEFLTYQSSMATGGESRGRGESGVGVFGDSLGDSLGDSQHAWLDKYPELLIFENDDADSEVKDLLSMNWRGEPDTWGGKRWIKVDGVVDSGACVPVAPPTMAPNVPIVESEGSKRGQKWTSASKHKVKNLGQQHILACTEAGNPTDVLFQIADVGKPLESVGTVCEQGNRVISGRGGGV